MAKARPVLGVLRTVLGQGGLSAVWRIEMRLSREKELLGQMEGAWYYCWSWDRLVGASGEGPFLGTRMRNLLSDHKSTRCHPRSWRWGRDAGDEPHSSGFRGFGKGKKQLNETFLHGLESTCPSW